MEYISRDAALEFEIEIEATPDELKLIMQGMAIYAEHLKSLPITRIETDENYD